MSLLARPAPEAVPIPSTPPLDLTVFLASLARGGAERVVVRWLARLDPGRHRVRLVVMGGAPAEYPVPAHVRVERLAGDRRRARLAALGRSLREGRPVLCHLLNDDDLATLWAQGVSTIPVVHNDRPAWRNTPGRFPPSCVPLVIAVSSAVADALRAAGWRGPVEVIRAPAVALPGSSNAAVRARLRDRLGIAGDELLVVMVGGVKPQKAYPRAVRVLAAIRAVRPARLAIIGGAIGRDGPVAWAALTAQVARLGLTEHVLTPGFVGDVGGWLAAADVLLNTSAFEGLSLATQEALAAGLPAVATDVGGQHEIASARLQLVPAEAAPEAIAAAVLAAPARRLPLGNGADVPAPNSLAPLRLWTGFAAWPERKALRRSGQDSRQGPVAIEPGGGAFGSGGASGSWESAPTTTAGGPASSDTASTAGAIALGATLGVLGAQAASQPESSSAPMASSDESGDASSGTDDETGSSPDSGAGSDSAQNAY